MNAIWKFYTLAAMLIAFRGGMVEIKQLRP